MPNNDNEFENYASPVLRLGAFMLMNPGTRVVRRVVTAMEAFPAGLRAFTGTDAVIVDIYVNGELVASGAKEIATEARGKKIRQSPELYESCSTAATGRALKSLGIPSQVDELQLLMQFAAVMRTPIGEPSAAAIKELSRPIQGGLSEEEDHEEVIAPTKEVPPPAPSNQSSPRAVMRAVLEDLEADERRELSVEAATRLGVKNVANPPVDLLDAVVELARQIKAGELTPTEVE